MAKRKRKLTAAQKAEKKRRQKGYMTIFINGKQKRVKRPPTIDGLDVDEFFRATALSVYLARTTQDKTLMRRAVVDLFGYDLDRTIEDLRPSYPFLRNWAHHSYRPINRFNLFTARGRTSPISS